MNTIPSAKGPIPPIPHPWRWSRAPDEGARTYSQRAEQRGRPYSTERRSTPVQAYGMEPARRLARRNTGNATNKTIDPVAQRRARSEGSVMSNTRRKLQWSVMALGILAAADLAINGWSLLRAAPPPQSTLVPRVEAPLQAGLVDRSRKGDRLVPAAPVAKTRLPPGCESQSSPLARLAPPNLIRQCVT